MDFFWILDFSCLRVEILVRIQEKTELPGGVANRDVSA
jgi:hypothetical protein